MEKKETVLWVPWPGFEPGLLRPQRNVLTTIRSRLSFQLTYVEFKMVLELKTKNKTKQTNKKKPNNNNNEGSKEQQQEKQTKKQNKIN